MIIFEPGGAKNLILLILVVFFTGIIAWQWLASDPFSNVKTENYFLNQIKNNSSDEIANIKDSISNADEDLENVGDEIIKETKQAQLIEETKKYIAEKANADLSESPDNQIDCEAASGQWQESDLKCLVATTDGGKECNDSSECQGYCAVDLSQGPEIYNKFISEGRAVEISGVCSENIFKYGCLAIVEEGWVKEIACVNSAVK